MFELDDPDERLYTVTIAVSVRHLDKAGLAKLFRQLATGLVRGEPEGSEQ